MTPAKEQTDSYYSLLTRRLIMTVIVVSFTPMVMVIAILLHQFEASYHEKTYAHLNEVVLKHKQNIDTFLKEKLANIQELVATIPFTTLSDKTMMGRELQNLKTAYGDVFVDMGLVDGQGRQTAYAGPYQLDDAFYGDAEWFQKAITQPYYISDVFMGLRGTPHFIITVRRYSNEVPWVLRATIDFRAFNTLVENLRLGRTGFAFIVNRNGDFQTRPPLGGLTENTDYEEWGGRLARSHEKVLIFERKDVASGNKNLYAVASLKDNNWLLVFKQETRDAFSDLNRMVQSAVLIFVLGGLAIIIMAVLLSRRMVRRIKRADSEKQTLNQQVIETGKLASVGELAAGIAHEINNPVAIMVEEAGWIGDLLEDESLKNNPNLPEIQRAITQIGTQGRRCKEITHKLLSFARKTDSTVKDVQLNDLIAEIVELSGQMAKLSKVNIVTELTPDLPYVTLSPSEMQQVMLNLINNAIDAMEKTGGTIRVSTKMSKLEKDHIVIVVEDDGPGIPEANLPLIFNPFFTTKPVGKGTGLGLSICYGIVEKMGGKIDVTSKVGEGTRFRVWIPY
ncbi:MAG: sensor histidine kinase, partial [Thermodesulfobacteriota bacterium]